MHNFYMIQSTLDYLTSVLIIVALIFRWFIIMVIVAVVLVCFGAVLGMLEISL